MFHSDIVTNANGSSPAQNHYFFVYCSK